MHLDLISGHLAAVERASDEEERQQARTRLRSQLELDAPAIVVALRRAARVEAAAQRLAFGRSDDAFAALAELRAALAGE